MKRLAGLFVLFSTASSVWAEEPQTLPEVKVVGMADDVAERREASTQKVVLDRKEIEKLSAQNISEVLGKLPGVEIKRESPRARGMSRDSVNILVDGERQASGSLVVFGALGRLPSSELERVEILRGSSAEFGGASPITINLVLKKATPKRSTETRAGIGSRGGVTTYSLGWTENGGEGGFAWSLPVSLIWSNSPINSLVDRQDWNALGTRTLWQQDSLSGVNKLGHHSITPRLTWKSGSDNLTVSPMFFYGGPTTRDTNTVLSKYNVPATGAGLAFNGDRNSREDSLNRTLRLRVDGEKHLGDSKLTGRASVNNSRRSSSLIRDVHDSLNVLTTFTESMLSVDNEINTALRWDQMMGMHLLSLGAEYVKLNRDDQQIYGGGYVAQNNNVAASRDGILWVQDDWTPQSSVTLTAGLRAESMRLSADGASQQHVGWLPSVAVRWEPAEKWVVRSSLGAGLKMPKVDEISNAAVRSLAANTPVEADRRGNPNLLPERSVNFEAVLERYLAENAGVFGANFYVRSARDFTERRVQIEGLRWVDRPYNEGNAMHWGVELDGKLRTDSLGWKGATVKAHLTLPHAQVDDARLGIQRMARDTPHYVLSAGVDQSLPVLQSSYGISLQLSGRSETDIPGEQYAQAKAKATLDAFWLYKLTPQFKMRVAGQNLLAADTVRRSVFSSAGNTWQLGSTDGGYRSLIVTLEGRW